MRCANEASLQTRLLEKVAAIARMDLHVHARSVAKEHQRNLGAGGAQSPHRAKKWRQLVDALTADFEHDIAGTHARALGGPAAGERADHEALLDLRRVEAEPRAHQP